MLKRIELQVKDHVTQLFAQANTTNLFYHNYQHTAEVVHRIETLAQDLSTTDLHLLKIAGWFHDLGYLYAYDKHEDRSMVLATDYLKDKLPDHSQITCVAACIEATKMSLKPRNHLEKIIKDADISYGVTQRFRETGTLLRKEWEALLEKKYSDKDWEILQYNFLKTVCFYTDQAKKEYHPILTQNIIQQKKRIK